MSRSSRRRWSKCSRVSPVEISSTRLTSSWRAAASITVGCGGGAPAAISRSTRSDSSRILTDRSCALTTESVGLLSIFLCLPRFDGIGHGLPARVLFFLESVLAALAHPPRGFCFGLGFRPVRQLLRLLLNLR